MTAMRVADTKAAARKVALTKAAAKTVVIWKSSSEGCDEVDMNGNPPSEKLLYMSLNYMPIMQLLDEITSEE